MHTQYQEHTQKAGKGTICSESNLDLCAAKGLDAIWIAIVVEKRRGFVQGRSDALSLRSRHIKGVAAYL